MTLDLWSPHRFCTGLTDPEGRLFLTDRVPFYYRPLADNRRHTVIQGDTLRGLAARYFAPLSYAAELWVVLGDFQADAEGNPAPIHDPTLELGAGAKLWIPSLATVLSEVFNEERRLQHDV